MEGKVSSQSPATPATRRRPLPAYKAANHRINPQDASIGGGGRSGRSGRMGVAAGECVAIGCCCPCAVAHFFLLAAYRLPRCLWRRKKRRNSSRNRISSSKETETNQRKLWEDDDDDDDESAGGGGGGEDHGVENHAVEWENEVWHGFWRSSSRRTNDD